MTFRVRVDINSKQFERWLGDVAQKEVPFVTAVTLTRTAADGQQEVRRQLPGRFNLRNRRVSQGIRIAKATKRKPVAELGSIDDFMVLQETGGIRKPRTASRLAVPTDEIKRTASGRIPAAKRPSKLLTRRNVFVRSGTIFQRTRAGVKALFVLTPSARIEPRLGLRKTAEDVGNRRMFPNFVTAFGEVLRRAPTNPRPRRR